MSDLETDWHLRLAPSVTSYPKEPLHFNMTHKYFDFEKSQNSSAQMNEKLDLVSLYVSFKERAKL